MKVTSVRVRRIYGKGLYAIASVTIDGELTINDIKVYRKGLYKEIKAAVLKQIDSYFYGEKGG